MNELDFPAEVFYRRLMSKVDDFGLYDARPSILRASLYPLRVDRVREADISRWIAICEKAGLIALYSAGGKPYLKVLDTRWQVRSEAKFPLPPASMCKQLQTVETVVVVEDVVVVEGVKPPAQGADAPSLEIVENIPLVGGQEFGVSKAFLAELEGAYPQVDGPATLKEIRVWCLANPSRCKTQRGAPRFINGWFERVQNNG